MRTFMRTAAVAALTMFVAFGSTGCDDVGDDGGGVPGTTLTTVTITTTTVSSTSTSVTTPTTLPPGNQQQCDVIFAIPETASVGALQFNADYSTSEGGFDGAGDQVDCEDLTGSLASFNDNEGTSTLSAGFINIAGFAAPLDVASCVFTTNPGNATEPVPGDFAITVVDATDPSLAPITVTVNARVENCQLIGGGPTTTVPGDTTTTTVPGGTTLPGNQFTIGFDVDGTATIGALQFSVDYSGAPGGFDGAADQVDCSDQTSSLASFNDDEAASTLAAGLINLAGFTAPTTVVTCVFTSTGAAPVPGDFTVTVEDAAAPDLTPITPPPNVTVTVTPL